MGIDVIQGEHSTKEQTNFVLKLMEDLENEKEELDPKAETGKNTVELFALSLFGKAQTAFENGRCDKVIARIFYASSVLIEVCNQFGPLDEDLVEKQKYAKWRAAQITKAVNSGEVVIYDPSENYKDSELMDTSEDTFQSTIQFQQSQQSQQPQQRTLLPPPPQSQLQQSQQSQHPQQYQQHQQPQQRSFVPPAPSSIQKTNPSNFDLNGNLKSDNNVNNVFSSHSTFTPPPHQSPTLQNPPPPTLQSTQNTQNTQGGLGSNTNYSNNTKAKSGYTPQQVNVSDDSIDEAQKYTKYALSALQFYDVPVAIQNLKDALKQLGHPI